MNDPPFACIPTVNIRSIRSCHVVVDCTYPGGQTVNIPEMIRQSFIQTLALMKRDAHYISLSSVMAYGVPEGDAEMKLHRVSQTVYGAIKRQSEEDLFYWKRCERKPLCFQTGQTHGVLQAATQSYRHALTYGDGVIHGGPEDALNTIFVHSLASSSQMWTRRLIPNTVYTLISSPHGLKRLSRVACGAIPGRLQAKGFPEIAYSKVPTLSTALIKSLGESMVLPLIPKLAPRLKGMYRVKVAAQGSHANHRYESRPIKALLGTCPGLLIDGLGCDFQTTLEAYTRIRTRLDRSLSAARQ